MDTVDVVRRAYEALEADDMETFFGLCTDDAEWVYPAERRIAYGGTWSRLERVTEFMETHDREEEILDFRIDDLLAHGNRVVGLGYFQGRTKSTGKVWETRFAHAITVRDGRISRFEAYFDTAAALDARMRRG